MAFFPGTPFRDTTPTWPGATLWLYDAGGAALSGVPVGVMGGGARSSTVRTDAGGRAALSRLDAHGLHIRWSTGLPSSLETSVDVRAIHARRDLDGVTWSLFFRQRGRLEEALPGALHEITATAIGAPYLSQEEGPHFEARVLASVTRSAIANGLYSVRRPSERPSPGQIEFQTSGDLLHGPGLWVQLERMAG